MTSTKDVKTISIHPLGALKIKITNGNKDMRNNKTKCQLLNSRSLMLGTHLLGAIPTVLTSPTSVSTNSVFTAISWNGRTIRRFYAKCATHMLAIVASVMEHAKNSVQAIHVMFVKALEKI